jgi:hypothetical protein
MNTVSKFLLACVAVAAIAIPASAQIGLSLSPVTSTVGVGGTATYNLNISGLFGSADYTGPALGGYMIQLDYNSAIASATAVNFGNNLGVDLVNLSGGALQTSDTSTPGQVFLMNISGDSVAALEAAQSKSFTLATITLQGVSQGTTSLSFDTTSFPPELTDASSNTLEVNTMTGATLSVIPEPSFTASVFGAAAIGFCAVRRKFSRRSICQA